MKALKIIGLVALILWMALTSYQLAWISHYAQRACTHAYLASKPNATVLDYPCP